MWKNHYSEHYPLKVSQFRKQIVKPWILSKNKQMNLFLQVCDMFLFVFLEEIEDSKKAFQNYLTFRTIHSNSEMSEQILVTECFINLFLEVSLI